MKQPFFSFLAAAVLLAGACQAQPPQGESPGAPAAPPARKFEKVREPAVAGAFYPKDKDVLRREVERLLADAKPDAAGVSVKDLRALICPHAGYEFSGPVAACGYKLLAGRKFSTVILLGPSHWVLFETAFVPAVDAYETPLGLVPLSPKAAELAKIEPFSSNPRRRVIRPDWAGRLGPALPPPGEDMPDTWEHSLEVELPFLQCTLHDFSIVPVVFGEVDPAAVAEKLLPLLDDDTLLVVSSDLSHYHPYEEAKALDARTVAAICDLRADRIGGEDACGHGPIAALIDIARRKGWTAHRLDYRNSGDTTGDKTRVVGYAAIAFTGPAASKYTGDERRLMLQLARESITAAVTGGAGPREDAAAPAKLQERRACFVTLTKDGRLRGCIGSDFPQESLYQAVIRRARAAATEDPRFAPVRADELKQIKIEISVLTLPKTLEFHSSRELLEKLRPGVDGVLLQVAHHSATFLPQVWEQLPDRRDFMGELSEKAGLAADAWTSPDAKVMTYQVEAFQEESEKAK